MNKRGFIILAILLCGLLNVQAQRFFNLTAQEVRIDSLLPQFTYSLPLGENYADSLYTVSISYPEFIDMSASDVAKYKAISNAELPALPVIRQQIAVSRKKGYLEISFCPLVFRDKKFRTLVSFMLDVQAKPQKRAVRRAIAATRSGASGRYAEHSVLASGNWAKISVSRSGVYQLTDALIRKAGFSDLSKVKIYGYGGALQNETLIATDLENEDDLKEIPTCTVNGKRLFYAQGPVSWSSKTATERTRNPYSDVGCYFLTQSDATPLTIDSTAFLSSFYPSADDYHSLHEVDNYAWYHGGRNLFENDPINSGVTHDYTLAAPSTATDGIMTIALTAGSNSRATVALNGTTLGSMYITLEDYDKGSETLMTYSVTNLKAENTISVTTTSGGPVRLDYIAFTTEKPADAPNLNSGVFSTPEYVYNITNQDHHADGAADMVIIIPTSQKLLAQAQRLKTFHEQHDSLRVKIVPSDELFNEFSSGTPDANAYRRYLKMLYDRASSEADMPKYLLLLGDCVWDNRMLTSDCKNLSKDDYLLCFESENSFNEVSCYVDDGFFCLLDDGEGANPQSSDKLDVAVGRFPVTTEAEAKIMVDKTINYVNNQSAGAWQNTLMFMGDDGNQNLHMDDVNDAAENIASLHPGYLIKKVMWDSYTRVSSATGNTYPEVTSIIKQQQANGALIMDYAGHGREDQISHEAVLKLADFEAFRNTNLPLWITASCDIMPFDGTSATIGEASVLNEKGGSVAFFGTTRTVYANYNKLINMAYLRHVLSFTDGKPTTMGEAQRLAKNEMITTGQDRTTNKLQYSLLGDPAVALKMPTMKVVVDSINGISTTSSSALVALKAGSVAKIKGHIENAEDFNGVMTATVRDAKELITCKLNDTTEADEAFQYYDRTKTLFSGSDSVSKGKFAFSFAVPKDISYSNGSGLMNIYAVNNEHTLEANGAEDGFVLGGSSLENTDSIGPSIYCYLNSPSFVNGGNVNSTPYFVAQVKDEDGINATGNGIGHNLELIIDGDMNKTYVLNDNFQYDFGTYTSGSTYYDIPELTTGTHKLLFRAWDILNNSSTAELTFNVVKGLEPNLFSVDVTTNPATTTTTFIINHDRTGSNMDVDIDVFDISGRWLWTHSESGVSTSNTYTVEWDLTTESGYRLQTGVYLYRVRIASDGSKKVSKAKKLIVLGNN
jgi:hypothetical protein